MDFFEERESILEECERALGEERGALSRRFSRDGWPLLEDLKSAPLCAYAAALKSSQDKSLLQEARKILDGADYGAVPKRLARASVLTALSSWKKAARRAYLSGREIEDAPEPPFADERDFRDGKCPFCGKKCAAALAGERSRAVPSVCSCLCAFGELKDEIDGKSEASSREMADFAAAISLKRPSFEAAAEPFFSGKRWYEADMFEKRADAISNPFKKKPPKNAFAPERPLAARLADGAYGFDIGVLSDSRMAEKGAFGDGRKAYGFMFDKGGDFAAEGSVFKRNAAPEKECRKEAKAGCEGCFRPPEKNARAGGCLSCEACASCAKIYSSEIAEYWLEAQKQWEMTMERCWRALCRTEAADEMWSEWGVKRTPRMDEDAIRFPFKRGLSGLRCATEAFGSLLWSAFYKVPAFASEIPSLWRGKGLHFLDGRDDYRKEAGDGDLRRFFVASKKEADARGLSEASSSASGWYFRDWRLLAECGKRRSFFFSLDGGAQGCGKSEFDDETEALMPDMDARESDVMFGVSRAGAEMKPSLTD